MKTKLLFPTFILTLLFAFGISSKASAQCQAGFTWTATAGTVQFTNTSIASSTPSCSWTFGDMSSIIGFGNMSHTYTIAGTYYVCLTINDTVNSCTHTFCDSVTVLAACMGFSSTVTSIDESAVSACDGSATGTVSGGTAPYAYTWSNLANTPTTTNLCAGSYTLTVTDVNGCIANSVATINSPYICTANFNYNVNGNTVNFTNMSNDTTTSTFIWDFGDFNSSTLINPVSHTYASAGTYNVLLAMNNSFFGCTDSIFQSITVGGPASCGAGFSMQQDSFNLLEWYIYPSVTGQAPFTYLWDFGDTTTSTLAYPTHNYVYAGHHDVCLTITDANLCSSTHCDSSTVHRMSSTSGMQYLTVVNVAAGIQEQHEFKGSIFPNPSSDVINIAFNKNVAGTLRINDISGKVILEKEFIGQQKQIDVSMLPQGIYSISFISETINWNEKIVIVR